MGAVMAGEMARAGCRVRLADAGAEMIERGLNALRDAQTALIRAGALSRRRANQALGRIEAVTDLASACAGVDLLVEAVPEKLDLKLTLFRRFDRLCPRHAILATNTSGLSISRIAAATRRPDRVAGLHFWNPPHIVPLVEVVKGQRTSEATAKRLLDFARRMGKRPVLVRRDIPGFIGNRLQFAVLREAMHLLEAGVASAEDIDAAMTSGPGLRYGLLGPLRTADLGGLDVFHAISSYLFANLCASVKPSATLSRLVKAGKLGAKTGEGFYPYAAGEKQRILSRRDAVLLAFLNALRQ
jgi:3-hydroxybutyryl-CoA dehydrogenase